MAGAFTGIGLRTVSEIIRPDGTATTIDYNRAGEPEQINLPDSTLSVAHLRLNNREGEARKTLGSSLIGNSPGLG
jgi:hypothetical protein